MAKNKLKTHKATRKVLNIRQSGSITKQVAGNNHQTGGKIRTGRVDYPPNKPAQPPGKHHWHYPARAGAD